MDCGDSCIGGELPSAEMQWKGSTAQNLARNFHYNDAEHKTLLFYFAAIVWPQKGAGCDVVIVFGLTHVFDPTGCSRPISSLPQDKTTLSFQSES
jgi:hypothetical protein